MGRYARQMKDLNTTLAGFDVHEAECQSEDDRKLILGSIEGMHGSLEKFNILITKDLKDSMNEDFEQQPSPAPYSLLIVSLSPIIAFFISCQSCTRNLPICFQVAKGVYV